MKKTILWLTLSAGLCGAYVAPGHLVVAQEFASAESCRQCHEKIYQQWRSSYHSQSASDPVFWEMFQRAVRDKGGRASAQCLTCHAPVATIRMEASPVRPVSFPLGLTSVAKEGVTCDVCHTISGKENLGKNISVGAYVFPRRAETAVKYGSHDDVRGAPHPTEKSDFLKSAEMCGVCHKFTHPLSGQELQNTYAEWYAGPYSRQGRRCQDCHMPAYTGKGADDGPERSDISAHVFQGGHTAMLKKAGIVTLSTRTHQDEGRKRIIIDALVTNLASGHLMPTGIPGIRELWLDVIVTNAEGAKVFEGRADFEAVLLDSKGNRALPWNALRIGTDTRIRPQKSRRERFQWSFSSADSRILNVEAKLYYRLVSETAARIAQVESSAPIEVATDRLQIFPDGSVKREKVQ